MMKWIATILLICLAAVIGFAVWYGWDCRTNRGFTFGYYGEFNRLTSALAAVPGVTIVDAGYNADVTLEEIVIDIADSRGQKYEISFGQNDPIRKLHGQELTDALAVRVERKSSNKTN